MSLRVKNFRWTQSPCFCGFYLQELNQVLAVNIGGKSFHASGRESGQVTVLKNSIEYCSS